MTKVKYDVTGVEPGQDFDTPVPVGLYVANIADVVEGTSKSSGNPMLTVTYSIIRDAKNGNKDWKGRNLWDYIVLNDSSAWKLRGFLEAVGLVSDRKQKGTLDTDALIGTKVQVRVKHDTDEEYGTRAKVGTVLAMPDTEPEEEPEEDEEPEEESADEEGDLTYAELQEYDRDELEELIDENDLEIRVTKRTSDEKLRERIAEELELEPEEEEPEEEPEESYDDMSLTDLKAECKQRGLSTAGTKKTLVKRLEKDDADDDGDDEPF